MDVRENLDLGSPQKKKEGFIFKMNPRLPLLGNLLKMDCNNI